EANKEALSLLNYGATGLIFEIEELQSIDFFVLFKNIEIRNIFVCIKFVEEQIALNTYNLFRKYLKEQGLQLKDINCVILFDPLKEAVKKNHVDKNIISTQIERICSIQQETRHISIDGTLYNNLGSNTVFELACVLA